MGLVNPESRSAPPSHARSFSCGIPGLCAPGLGLWFCFLEWLSLHIAAHVQLVFLLLQELVTICRD
jgi:hypothetical protein